MTWVAVRVEPAGDGRLAAAALFEAGALGVQEDGSVLVTHFPSDSDVAAVVAAVRTADPGARVTTTPVPDVDWAEAWKAAVQVHEVGRLVVTPPWLADDLDPARAIIVDPGMAFGTGDHPTTRGVLRLMQQVIRPGSAVADLGAGSAVLSIAAAKLGAARVAAIEVDTDAIGNAAANVERNGVADRVAVLEGDAATLLPLVAPIDVALANIVSSVIRVLLPVVRSALAPGGAAVIGGVLVEESETMRQSLGDTGWVVEAVDQEDIWWSAVVRPR